MLVECPNCHELYDNAVDDACPKCTVTHEIVCPKCGSTYSPSFAKCPYCGVNNDAFVPVSAATLLYPSVMYIDGEGKDRRTAAMLALLLGGFGIHEFYLGNTRAGIFMLLFSWTGIPSAIAIGQGIRYLKMTDDAFVQMMKVMRQDEELHKSIR